MRKINTQWINSHPAGKLIIALTFSVTVLILNSLSSLLLVAGLSILACLVAQVSLPYALKRLFIVNFFLLFVWLALPWQIVVEHNSLHFQAANLWLALVISLKCNAILLIWMSLLWQTSQAKLLATLASWGCPDKLLALFFLFYRFIWLIKEEYYLLRTAMRARGFSAKLNLHSLRSLAQLVATLLARGFDRGETVYNAMLCRGFNGKYYFSNNEAQWRGTDFIILIISLICLFLPLTLLHMV